MTFRLQLLNSSVALFLLRPAECKDMLAKLFKYTMVSAEHLEDRPLYEFNTLSVFYGKPSEQFIMDTGPTFYLQNKQEIDDSQFSNTLEFDTVIADKNMKSAVPELVIAKCNEFVGSFNNSVTSQATRNIFHDKTWKESDGKLLEITERILNILGEIWRNLAFESSVSRSEQSERTYISDIIMPLLRSSLGNLLNGNICLSTAERQSIASKARRNAGVDKERIGKKPDIMGLLKYDEKIAEFMFAECFCIVCCNSKKDDNDVKLWRETLDGMSFLDSLCRPTSNQFGVVGIQVAGTTIRLNVLVRDLGGILRYFHLDHAEIPLLPHLLHTKALIRLLLTLRNILIVNKSLLMEALVKANSHPPRNAHPNPAVSTPTREEQTRTRKVSDIDPPLREQRLNKKKSRNLQNKF
ncbi:8587_t:CDS:2, partial [Scutellospora calospora]